MGVHAHVTKTGNVLSPALTESWRRLAYANPVYPSRMVQHCDMKYYGNIRRCTLACRRDSCNHGDTVQTGQHMVKSDPETVGQRHEFYMNLALDQARIAYKEGEVPVGAVLVGPDGNVLSQGYNRTEQDNDPTAHAEMACIRHATSTMANSWRLLACTLYVTLEPCPMCAGAILQSRVGTLVYGARNTLLGADGSWIQMFPCESSTCEHEANINNHRYVPDKQMQVSIPQDSKQQPRHPFHPNIRIIRGVMSDQCSGIMQDFFKQRRNQQ